MRRIMLFATPACLRAASSAEARTALASLIAAAPSAISAGPR
jgi:hypothetical protein